MTRHARPRANIQRLHSAAVAAALGILAGYSHAADGTDDLVTALTACADEATDAARLACYDALASRVSASRPASSAGNDAERFGLGTPARPRAQADAADGPASIQSRVVRVREPPTGEALIELENGQVWRQSDTATLLLKAGDVVTISRGALGSFHLTTPSRRTGRVKRVR